ncbi:hypothetical protein CMUS01_02657 [Colletotrichum musicola]|uniref:Uncharacterized protein n=1 Tax=Colletotrichum musicola TaxID=2175873 RepID=A0A8H6NUS2_9PEZI|nr:hypothetical protein CMUS01_02657 [Colletotrichum musicola]
MALKNWTCVATPATVADRGRQKAKVDLTSPTAMPTVRPVSELVRDTLITRISLATCVSGEISLEPD